MFNYKNFGLFDSPYALLIYFIKFTNQIDNTYYFISEGIPNDIRNNLQHTFLKKKRIKSLKNSKVDEFISKIFWNKKIDSIIKNLDVTPQYVYGQDHILGGNYFLSKYRFKLIEDGLANYSEYTDEQSIIKRLIFKVFNIKIINPFGREINVDKIYLTGMAPIPEKINKKVEVINLYDLWNQKTEKEKIKILNIFNFDIAQLDSLKNRNTLLLTQPLSEDGHMTEEEKVKIYREIISNVSEENLVIKVHPREITDYQLFFPNSLVISKPFPSQLFAILGVNFNKVITLFSSAINDFILSNTEIIFCGTNIHKNLIKEYGNIIYNEKNKRIELSRELK